MTLSERNAKIEAHNEKILKKITSTEKPVHSLFVDITGLKFRMLTAVKYAGRSGDTKYYWSQCDCGSNLKLISSESLSKKGSRTYSCGCLVTKINSSIHTKHGLSKDPWYNIAASQQQRISNQNDKNYGGRGLTFGEGMETIEERILFYHEHFGPEPPLGMQVDRTNVDKGYSKDNVRLVTPKENSSNKRISHGFSGGFYSKKSRIYGWWVFHKSKDNLCNEWAADFKVFLADIGGEDLPKGKYLARFDVEKPFGPDNYYFSDTIQRRPSYLMPK